MSNMNIRQGDWVVLSVATRWDTTSRHNPTSMVGVVTFVDNNLDLSENGITVTWRKGVNGSDKLSNIYNRRDSDLINLNYQSNGNMQ